MYMQIIQGKIKDRQAARATMDRWLTDLQPGAAGWLGGTYGVTDDNMLVACVRFQDAAAAKANSDRPEQSAWWTEMEKNFAGPVTFHDCDDVTLLLGGGSDDAGFVQVIQGKVADPSRMKAVMYGEESTAMLHEARPDILGGTLAFEDDGTFTETIAFTSEAAAREGEQKPMDDMPDDVRATLDEAMAGARFYDLHHPWFASA